MKSHRIYQNISLNAHTLVSLSDAASTHISRALRLKVGDKICLFNGLNQECLATISQIDKRAVEVKLDEVNCINRESPFKITLVQALSKGERFDLVVQKAVELGVHQLIPVITERTVVKLDEKRRQKKLSHWQGIIESASEQCGRNALMQLEPIQPLKQYLASCNQEKTHYILDPYSAMALKSLPKPKQDAAFIIGPEGGFNPQEAQNLTQAQVTPISLGPRILRTETAAIAICSIFQAIWGDL